MRKNFLGIEAVREITPKFYRLCHITFKTEYIKKQN